MTLRLNDSYRNKILNNGWIGMQGNTELRIYTGPQPGSAASAPTGTLLAAISLPATAFNVAVPAGAPIQLTKTGTWQGTAEATGVAGWFRMIHLASGFRMDGAVTAAGGGGELELDSTTINDTAIVTINTWDIQMPTGAGGLLLSDGAATDLLNVGLESAFNSGKIALYSGSVPADANSAISDPKLVEIVIPTDAFAVSPSGQAGRITKLGTWSATTLLAGLAAFFRMIDSAGSLEGSETDSPNARIQGTVGIAAEIMVMANVNILTGGSVAIDTFSLDMPAA